MCVAKKDQECRMYFQSDINDFKMIFYNNVKSESLFIFCYFYL